MNVFIKRERVKIKFPSEDQQFIWDYLHTHSLRIIKAINLPMIHVMMEITITASIPSSLNPMPRLVVRAKRNRTMALTAIRNPIFSHFPAELKSAIFKIYFVYFNKKYSSKFSTRTLKTASKNESGSLQNCTDWVFVMKRSQVDFPTVWK